MTNDTPSPAAADQPRGLSLLIPAYNEEELLETAVAQIEQAAAQLSLPYELVIVNDGSADRTGEILDGLAARDEHLHAIHHERNRGIGGGIVTAGRQARYDCALWCPVDSPPPVEQMRALLAAWAPDAVVVGYRPARLGYRGWQHFGSTVYHWMACRLLGLRLRDMNWIHMYPTRLFSEVSIRFSGIVYLGEVLAKAQRAGYRLVEVETPMIARIKGVATISKPRAIWRTFWDLWRLSWHLRLTAGRPRGRA
jgi:glycosyltransferase involved in cell wall biosynthesis